MLFTRFIIASALTSTAFAQLSGLTSSLSSTCQGGATQLLASDFASCSSLLSLVSVVTASGSVIDPLNSWLETLCQQDACTSDEINAAVAIVDDKCATDLASGNEIATLLRSVITNFSTEREAGCLASTSNSTLCVTQLLESIQTSSGSDLTLNAISSLATNTSLYDSIQPSTLCTDCNHALVSAVSSIDTNGTLSSYASTTCGASYADGQIPSTVSALAESNSTSGGSVESTPIGAAGRLHGGKWIEMGSVVAALAIGVAALA